MPSAKIDIGSLIPKGHNPEAIMSTDAIERSESITPTQYFESVKSFQKTTTVEALQKTIEVLLSQIRKTSITGQKDLADALIGKINLVNKELQAVDAGFNTYVVRADIELYLRKIENKSVKLIEFKKYKREIPDECLDKIIAAKNYFDELVVVFTDYSDSETRAVEKERRDKDPILFGIFCKDNGAPEERFYFICDWIDEKCHLTLEEMVRDFESKIGRPMMRKIDYSGDIEDIKKRIDEMDGVPEGETASNSVKLEDAEKEGLKITIRSRLKEAAKKVRKPRKKAEKSEDSDESKEKPKRTRRSTKKKDNVE